MAVSWKITLCFECQLVVALLALFAASACAETKTLQVQAHLTVQGHFERNSGGDAYTLPIRAGQYVRLSIIAMGIEFEASLADPKTEHTTIALVAPAETV